MIDQKRIIDFYNLQKRLIEAFFISYPTVKDFEWLLDFPKSGNVLVNDELWGFIKHGKGIKFFIKHPGYDEVVDVNNNIGNAKVADVWRLSQYFSCCDDSEIKYFLDEMVLSGTLQKISEKQYELI